MQRVDDNYVGAVCHMSMVAALSYQGKVRLTKWPMHYKLKIVKCVILHKKDILTSTVSRRYDTSKVVRVQIIFPQNPIILCILRSYFS